jgi:hypothetical protein
MGKILDLSSETPFRDLHSVGGKICKAKVKSVFGKIGRAETATRVLHKLVRPVRVHGARQGALAGRGAAAPNGHRVATLSQFPKSRR